MLTSACEEMSAFGQGATTLHPLLALAVGRHLGYIADCVDLSP